MTAPKSGPISADRLKRGEAIAEGRRRMLTSPGHVYAAYSRGECWIKLGFSLDVTRRIHDLNSRFKPLAPFTLIGTTPSTYRAERQLHRILQPFRDHQIGLSRELYLSVPALERVVREVVSSDDRPPLHWEDLLECTRWSRAQV